MLENTVFLELKKRYGEVFYYRENQNECDFIRFDQIERKAAYQVCFELSSNNKKREIQGLIAGCKKISFNYGFIISYDQNEQFQQDSIEIKTIPCWKWLLFPDTSTPKLLNDSDI